MSNWSKSVAKLRREYGKDSFDIQSSYDNPIDQFNLWFKEAVDNDLSEPNRFVLSTVNNLSEPSSRIVLMKDVINNKFVFYTNYQSQKAKDIEGNNNVSINFHWYEMERQVRIQGKAIKVSSEMSDEYYNSRSLTSRIGAIVSKQSHELTNKSDFLKEVLKEGISVFGSNPKRPDYWGGYEIEPTLMEFWQGRKSRLHDRIQYLNKDGVWSKKMLYP